MLGSGLKSKATAAVGRGRLLSGVRRCVSLVLAVPLLFVSVGPRSEVDAQNARAIQVPTSLFPQTVKAEFRLNYYYDRSGRWTKFSDWIPFKQKKWNPRFLEDFYMLHGLPMGYKPHDLKERIYLLHVALNTRFRHPRHALCKIETSQEYHKYRLLMFMKVNHRRRHAGKRDSPFSFLDRALCRLGFRAGAVREDGVTS